MRSLKEIAKTVRSSLKEELPQWKFSVQVLHGSSISLSLMAGPQEVCVGYVDSNTRQLIEKPIRYAQLNHYTLLDDRFSSDYKSITNGYVLTETGWEVMKKACEILSREHWDESDSQVDYFNCAFYRSVAIGKWNKDYQAKGN